MRSPWSLAPRRCHHSSRHRRSLPLLRRLSPQRSPAARPALPHAPPLAHRAPASPPPPPLTSEPAGLQRSRTEKVLLLVFAEVLVVVTFRIPCFRHKLRQDSIPPAPSFHVASLPYPRLISPL